MKNIGVIGLGRMGGPIAKKFYKVDCQLTVYDIKPEVREEYKNLGMSVALNISDLSAVSDIIWIMVPQNVVDSVLDDLCACTETGTIIIDGGNSFFKDTIRRAQELKKRKIEFLDCGTSGGLWGAERGFSLTVGGDHDIFLKVNSIFNLIAAAKDACIYVGPSGSGHYVKMIHNGIEYALFESYAEGFNLLHNGYYKDLDLSAISHTWQKGAVIRSWILELIHDILLTDQNFTHIKGIVGEHGTGRWTVEEAHEQNIPVPAIENALKVRQESRVTGGNYTTKLIALIRHKMGGHTVKQDSCKACLSK